MDLLNKSKMRIFSPFVLPLKNAGFRLNKKKVIICQTSLPMLGSILTAGPNRLEIMIDPKKMEAIEKFPVPTSVTRIKSFLGACQ